MLIKNHLGFVKVLSQQLKVFPVEYLKNLYEMENVVAELQIKQTV